MDWTGVLASIDAEVASAVVIALVIAGQLLSIKLVLRWFKRIMAPGHIEL